MINTLFTLKKEKNNQLYLGQRTSLQERQIYHLHVYGYNIMHATLASKKQIFLLQQVISSLHVENVLHMYVVCTFGFATVTTG
jgi:hypothetical protein